MTFRRQPVALAVSGLLMALSVSAQAQQAAAPAKPPPAWTKT